MPNFKCQNNLKDPKRDAVERQATFYSLSSRINNKQGMGGVSKTQLKKKRYSFEAIACTLQFTSGWKFTATANRVAKDSDKTGRETLWMLKRTLRKLRVAFKKRLYDLIALIIPEVEIQFMFSRFLVQLLCWIQPPSSTANFSARRRRFYPPVF